MATDIAKRRRRRRILLVSLFLFVIIAYCTYTPIISSIIGYQLRQAISSRLHAELRYDSLIYHFPYGVSLQRVQLLTDAELGGDELIAIDRLNITLARFPLPRRPIVVKNLELTAPAIRLIRTPEGLIGTRGMQRRQEELQDHPPEQKLSEMFELRKFVITEGRFIYVDRSLPNAQPLVFSGIGMDLGVVPQSGSVYGFEMKTQQPPATQLDASGTLDIDQALMDLTHLAAVVEVRPNEGNGPGGTKVPPQLQKLVNTLHLNGSAAISGKAKVPLRDISGSVATLDLSLTNVQAKWKRANVSLDALDGRVHGEFSDRQGTANVEQFSARSGAARLTVQDCVAEFGQGRWKVNSLGGVIEAVATGPATEPATIGRNYVLSGTAIFSGNASGDLVSAPRFVMNLKARDMSIFPNGFSRAIDAINGEIQFSPEAIQLQQISATALNGKVRADGVVRLQHPPEYDLTVSGQELDLNELTAMPLMRTSAAAAPASGLVNFNVQASGQLPTDGSSPLEKLTGSGEFEVTHGKLWKLKLLERIAESTGIQANALTVSEAAGVFTVNQQTVNLSRAAVNSSALGLQGKGSVGFDGQLDLDIIAAPLGDWRAHIEKTRIPIISNLAGELASRVQKLVNAATSRLLYEFEVKGKLPDFTIRPIPAPILTDAAAGLFGRMLQEVREHDLLKSLRETK